MGDVPASISKDIFGDFHPNNLFGYRFLDATCFHHTNLDIPTFGSINY